MRFVAIPFWFLIVAAHGQDFSEHLKISKLSIYNKLVEGDKERNLGNLTEAENHYLEALEISKKLIAAKSSHRISILPETLFSPYERLGKLYLLANNSNKARTYFEEELGIVNSILPKRSVFKIPPYVGLGEIALANKDLLRANEHFKMAGKLLNRATTSFVNFDPIEKSILFNRFEIALLNQDYKEARKILDKLSTGGMSTMDVGNSESIIPRVFECKARYYLHLKEYEKADFYLKKARYHSSALTHSTIGFQIQRTDALLQWAQGDIRRSFRLFLQLVDEYKNYIKENFAALTEYEKERFFSSLKQDFDLYNAFVLANKNGPDFDQMVGSVYNNQLFGKALLLNEINKQKRQILSSDDEGMKKVFREWEQQKNILSSLYYSKGVKEMDFQNTKDRIAILEKQLAQGTQHLQDFNATITWQKVKEHLKSGEVAIEIVRVPHFDQHLFNFTTVVSYMAIMVSSAHDEPEFVEIMDGGILETRYLGYYRNAILNKTADELSYSSFWKPLKPSLSKYNKVYLSSDGVYNQINLNVLMNPETGQYLLDEIDLALVTNTKDLLDQERERPNSVLVNMVGRPSYARKSLLEVGQESLGLRSIRSEELEDFREQVFSDLPGTEDEITGVTRVLEKKGSWAVKSYLGERATETVIKSFKNPYVLHIATHGFFLKESATGINSMIRSGLILAGVNSQIALDDDGILTAYEATNLSLDSTYLVVLSACETGLGEVKNGEGVYGLQRGFAVAGAQYVLMSLWKVDDFATRLFMEDFYNFWLEGSSVHEAVKRAQQKLRAQYPHPFYWGAFVLSGS